MLIGKSIAVGLAEVNHYYSGRLTVIYLLTTPGVLEETLGFCRLPCAGTSLDAMYAMAVFIYLPRI